MIRWTMRPYARRNEIIRITLAIVCIGLPLIIPLFPGSHFKTITRWYDRARHIWRARWPILQSRNPPSETRDETCTYPSSREESAYWDSAFAGQRQLAFSDAHRAAIGSVPIITSYQPALLPHYRRERRKIGAEGMNIGVEYYLPARTFCKWHRMVFPGPVHPTIQQASKQRKHFSNRDLREMFRISRLESNEVIFARSYRWTPRYRDMWKRWLEEKGPDIAVVFA